LQLREYGRERVTELMLRVRDGFVEPHALIRVVRRGRLS
jgi:hypothetical protein